MKDIALTVGRYEIQTPSDTHIFPLFSLIQWAITILFTISILLTLFFLVSGGIDMITSGGEKQKVVNSRHKLTFAVVGLIIVLLSFFIVNVVGSIFGLKLFGDFGVQCVGSSCLTP